jgi:hypothetical protein
MTACTSYIPHGSHRGDACMCVIPLQCIHTLRAKCVSAWDQQLRDATRSGEHLTAHSAHGILHFVQGCRHRRERALGVNGKCICFI